MTIYTFYQRTYGDNGRVSVAGVLDTEKKEVTGDPSGTLIDVIMSAVEDIQDEQMLLRAFYNGSRLWARKGEPITPLHRTEGGGFNRPKLRLVR